MRQRTTAINIRVTEGEKKMETAAKNADFRSLLTLENLVLARKFRQPCHRNFTKLTEV